MSLEINFISTVCWAILADNIYMKTDDSKLAYRGCCEFYGGAASITWIPDENYYVKLIGRLVDVLEDKKAFPDIDWRFNEFPNQGVHALHVTCIELMALPRSSQEVAEALVEVIPSGHAAANVSNISAWLNALGLVFTSLPKVFLDTLNDRNVEILTSICSVDIDPFVAFDFAGTYNPWWTEHPSSYLIALTHSVCYHANIGQLSTLPQLCEEKFKPAVKTEIQFLYVCHLVASLLIRFHPDRLHSVKEILTSEAAEERGKEYDNAGRSYLSSHFINHSCEPNLHVFAVWINNQDPHLPRLAFFAKRKIARGEELTFDYKMVKTHREARPMRMIKSCTSLIKPLPLFS